MNDYNNQVAIFCVKDSRGQWYHINVWDDEYGTEHVVHTENTCARGIRIDYHLSGITKMLNNQIDEPFAGMSLGEFVRRTFLK